MVGVFVGFAIILTLGLFFWEQASKGKRRERWAAIATRHGLDYDRADTMSGRIGETTVSVNVVSRGSGKNRRDYTQVTMSGGLPAGLELAREGFFSSFSDDVRTGDRDFDDAVRIKGNRGLALAVLDGTMRPFVKGLVQEHWSYADGTWTLLHPKMLKDELDAAIEIGLQAAERFREGGRAIPTKLAERAQNDPDASVRRTCLEHLDQHFAASKQRRAAFEAALHDRSASVRLMAGLALEHLPTLIALATTTTMVPDSVRATAAAGLASAPDDPAVIAAVEALIDEHEGMDKALLIALVRLLREVPSARAEWTSVALLASNDDDVKLEAIKTLAKVGTVDSVRALLPLRDRAFAMLSETAGAAKDAILQIQARAGGGEAGALSVAEAVTGLAIVDAEATDNELA